MLHDHINDTECLLSLKVIDHTAHLSRTGAYYYGSVTLHQTDVLPMTRDEIQAEIEIGLEDEALPVVGELVFYDLFTDSEQIAMHYMSLNTDF